MTFTSKYNSADGLLRQKLRCVLELRHLAWEHIRRSNLHLTRNATIPRIQHLRKVCILASSSRGGSSVTAELLQWQGADCDRNRGRIISLPGEEKPHLILSGFAFPARPERFDNLSETEAAAAGLAILLKEIESEIGYPMLVCQNMELYACQLYRRLLLQWPLHLTKLDMLECIARLSAALNLEFPDGYWDSVENKRRVLAICMGCFNFIRPSFYDCSQIRREEDLVGLPFVTWSIEETPFVLPPPWHNATAQDIKHGCLLLRDPSTAWRLPFWRAVFREQGIHVLHLVRDPREAVQGLCDGWNYPFGFQTMPSQDILNIPGYTNVGPGGNEEWKRHSLNFSVSQALSRDLLVERKQMSLVEVCARQWQEAHESILANCAELELPRTLVRFGELRTDTEATFRRICASQELECSWSGLAYARSFGARWVMATASNSHSPDRWKGSPFTAEIRSTLSAQCFERLCKEFNLPELSPEMAPHGIARGSLSRGTSGNFSTTGTKNPSPPPPFCCA